MLAIVSCDDTYGDMNWDSKTIVTANGLFTLILYIIVLLQQ